VVRGTGVVVVLEGLVALLFAVALVIDGIRGGDARIAYGTAAWFVLVFAALSAAGLALWRGRRWGRGVAVFAQLLIVPVAYYMASGSRRPELGLPLGLVALITLALLFCGPALKWAAYQSDSAESDSGQSDSARSDNAGPDKR
jgi:hypothetical protein